jgi:hypothetical protein
MSVNASQWEVSLCQAGEPITKEVEIVGVGAGVAAYESLLIEFIIWKGEGMNQYNLCDFKTGAL